MSSFKVSSDSLRSTIQWGAVLIVAIMPFHAFLSVWLGSLFGHQAAWQSWKELLTLILVSLTVWYVYKNPGVLQRWRQPLWYAVAGFVAIATLVTLAAWPGATAAVFGAKTDLEPLVVAAIAAVVADPKLVQRLVKVLLATSAIVVTLALLQVYILPKEFLSGFGYSSSTITPYMLVDPALPAIRAFATLGGALQLGSFLLLPLALVAALMIRQFRWWQPIMLLATGMALWHTHSRAAWIGAIVAIGVIVILRLPSRWRLPSALIGIVTAAIGLNILISLSSSSSTLQYYLFHGSIKATGYQTSTELHGLAIQTGQQELLRQPLGQGLGTAGPASYHTDRPLIPESQYLQIGIETGFVGLALFLIIQIILALQLLKRHEHSPLATALVSSLAGIAVLNLALHGWADSSTALVYWAMAGAYIGAES
ncbi:O-antigen ligase domain-containing protein [Patescibacteria group bacterium]|nr:MAG: O-antigen ligase domain-containing protein [Patescibacteria group bacterium]